MESQRKSKKPLSIQILIGFMDGLGILIILFLFPMNMALGLNGPKFMGILNVLAIILSIALFYAAYKISKRYS